MFGTYREYCELVSYDELMHNLNDSWKNRGSLGMKKYDVICCTELE
jgi:hypothetical protein